MKQFDKFENAVTCVIKENGIDVLRNQRILISLISDYAPELVSEQLAFRSLVRMGCGDLLHDAIINVRNKLKVFPPICVLVMEAIDDSEMQGLMFEAIDSFLNMNDTGYCSGVDAQAIYEEGMKYFRNFPREKNIPISIYLLKEAGNKGIIDAFMLVASCYLKGKGVMQDIEKGMKYLNLAISSGSTKAKYELAQRYWRGDGIEKNVDKAIELFLQIANNNSDVQLALGEIYDEQQNHQAAYKWYCEASKNASACGQYIRAVCLATGRGVRRDLPEAKKWLRSAASLGHFEAISRLKELGEKWD